MRLGPIVEPLDEMVDALGAHRVLRLDLSASRPGLAGLLTNQRASRSLVYYVLRSRPVLD
jgi:hypothetical protein